MMKYNNYKKYYYVSNQYDKIMQYFAKIENFS